MKKVIIKICERGLGILSYILPCLEISQYFARRVFLGTDSTTLHMFYINYLNTTIESYQSNLYFAFGIVLGLFYLCSRGAVPLTKFLRFNILQALLLYIISSCLGQLMVFYCP